MLDIQFTPIAFEQYNQWPLIDKKIYQRLQKLIVCILRSIVYQSIQYLCTNSK